MSIDFGIFDHLDRGGFALGELYANRLRLIEAYGMLDQLSGGRLELGVGRGFSPFEIGFFGVKADESRERYLEAFQVLMRGLTSSSLTFEGRHFRYLDVPMVLQPVQRPHPPLWYGLTNVEGAPWAAALGVNVLMNGPAARTRPLTETYREEFAKAPADIRARAPKLGLTRHVHVADSDAEALDVASRAYATWYASNAELWKRFKTETRIFPPTLEDALRLGTAIVGSPATVAARIDEDLRASGANYLVSRLAFGDLPSERVMHAVDLFAAEIMPRFQPAASASPSMA